MTELPESMDECFYFTRRKFDNNGSAVAWVEKPICSSCGKAKMGKPVAKGKVKVRAKEYVCPSCSLTVPKEEFEPTLDMIVHYKCPHCGKEGEANTKYKRKKFKGVDAYIFECEGCNEKIPLTKKLKALKK